MTADRLPRRRTGDPELDRRLLSLLDGHGRIEPEDRDLLFEMLATVVRMAGEDVDRLDLKITNAALKEMRRAFRVFAPWRDVPKVTIFGSARTQPDDPLYVQTRDLAAALAGSGWMVVTGAGPGIMAAGAEGAGRERSIGVNIRLPFEQEANAFIASDPKLVSMKYFFTRKLMLMKESAGFVVLPGGFGTLDEMFELLTLLQTGKAAPAPLVLLDVPGGTYWEAWDRFTRTELAGRGLVSPDDLRLCRITTDVGEAVSEVLGFFRNYHSMRYVGARLVLRLRAAPTDAELAGLNRDFADICTEGGIDRTGPLPAEVGDADHTDLPRLVLHFDRMNLGRLRALIDAVNALPSAPPLSLPDRDAAAAAGSPPEAGGGGVEARASGAVIALLEQASSSEVDAATTAAAGLRAQLADGGLAREEADWLASEIAHLAVDASSPPVRLALLDALAAASPFVALDQVLDLLLEHEESLGHRATLRLVETLETMLRAVSDGGAAGNGVATLLQTEDPLPVLDRLSAAPDPDLAARARAARAQVERIVTAG